MNGKLRQLKVKIKSLAEEQRIIRHEEGKALKSDMWLWRQHKGTAPYSPDYWTLRDGNLGYGECTTNHDLRDHRIIHVRPEIRSANIAYGLLRGRTLEQIETPRSEKSLARKPYREPDWKRIEALLKKYGSQSKCHELMKKAA